MKIFSYVLFLSLFIQPLFGSEGDSKMRGSLFLISGPSGVGKTTLVETYLKRRAQTGDGVDLKRVITYTTRAPRAGEKDGEDYHFVDYSDFVQRKDAQFFLETSKYGESWYGTPGTILEDVKNGQSYLIVIDRAGAHKIASCSEYVTPIWLHVPTIEILEKRLRERGTDPEERIQRRLEMAEIELLEELGNPTYPNRIETVDFESSFEQFSGLVQTVTSR